MHMATGTQRAFWAKQSLSLCSTEYVLELITHSSPLTDCRARLLHDPSTPAQGCLRNCPFPAGEKHSFAARGPRTACCAAQLTHKPCLVTIQNKLLCYFMSNLMPRGPWRKAFCCLLRREGVISIHYHCTCTWHTETALVMQSQSTVVYRSTGRGSVHCHGTEGLQFQLAAKRKSYSLPKPLPSQF